LKRTLLVILVVTLVSLGVSFSFAADKPTGGKVIAYYFHGNFRCPTCFKLEQYSKEAIEVNFKGELASGKLVFNVINTDERENEHFVKDYQLYTKSLVISLVKDGKEVKHKNLAKIWDYVGNKNKFYNYVTEEIKNFLKEP
jgi:hypothetical protein